MVFSSDGQEPLLKTRPILARDRPTDYPSTGARGGTAPAAIAGSRRASAALDGAVKNHSMNSSWTQNTRAVAKYISPWRTIFMIGGAVRSWRCLLFAGNFQLDKNLQAIRISVRQLHLSVTRI
jgi:hypothetical protein